MSASQTKSPRVGFCVYDTPDGKVGGPIAWALDLLPWLKSSGIEIEAIVLRQGGSGQGRIAETCHTYQIPVHYLDTANTHFLEDQIEWILQLCRENGFQQLVANLVLPAWYAARHLRKSNITTIGVIHSDPNFDRFYRDLLDQFVAHSDACPDIIVPVSDFIDQIVASKSKSQRLTRSVIPCGCRLHKQQAMPPRDELKLVYAGRLVSEQKRIIETTQALLTTCTGDGISGTIYGDGPERESIEQLLEHQSNVQYGGQLAPADLPVALSCHHVMVLLSDYEGLPIALLEGMACGLVPVCLSGTSGVGEVIEDGVNGLLVEDRGESLQKAIAKLRDTAFWSKLSTAAMNTVRTRYSHEVTFSKWHHLLTTSFMQTVNHQQIPRHIGQVSRDGRFAGYPSSRPGLKMQIAQAIGQYVASARQTLRPRARLRAFQKFMRGER